MQTRQSQEQASYYRSPSWRALRAAALEAGGNACCACGRQAASGLHVHHVYGFKADPEGRHLVVLCRACHETVEQLARRKSRLTDQMLVTIIALARVKIGGPPDAVR